MGTGGGAAGAAGAGRKKWPGLGGWDSHGEPFFWGYPLSTQSFFGWFWVTGMGQNMAKSS